MSVQAGYPSACCPKKEDGPDIFKRYDSDFYKIDPMLFSPAEVWLTSTTSGRTCLAGRLDPAVLRASLFET